MTSRTKTQIETVETITKSPRFALRVDGVTVRVTRFGTDEDGLTWFEIASFGDYPNSKDVRDTFPTDYGFVKDGHVYMQIQDWDDDAEGWTNTRYTHIGSVESSRYRVGDSVSAELGGRDPHPV